ncbi:hypothetical protein [uncultured Streptomyces sp.]|uniref:hypothetical protein n=1 Tax=uncultured Streptomyces sp. TaxID=174707 RepID=UPI00261A1CF8|nr:hypothetical protein [uncultured Streptomyces sp.]
MRSLPLTLCAATAAAAISLSAPVALAGQDDGRGTLSVTPSALAPGDDVELRTDACRKGRQATGNSDAFVSEARFAPAEEKGLVAEARIRSDADAGAYDVWLTCRGGGRATGTLTVVHDVRPSPVAPVKAGGGGTAALAGQGARSEGPGTPHAVIGLVLAAAAAVAVAFRSARRRRPAVG